MSEQRNPYLGRTPRPWLELRFLGAVGESLPLKLIADTGSPQGLILAPHWFDRLVRSRAAPIRNNFGDMSGGWLQLFMPETGLVELVRGYSSATVGEKVAKSHPDFAGLVGLPILRLGEYGGDATDFWFRHPTPERPGPP